MLFANIMNNKLKNFYLDWYLCRIFCKCRKFKIIKDEKLIMMDTLLSTFLMSYKPSGWRQVLHELQLNSNWFGVPNLILDWNNPWLGRTYLHVKLQITRAPFPQELDDYVNKKKLITIDMKLKIIKQKVWKISWLVSAWYHLSSRTYSYLYVLSFVIVYGHSMGTLKLASYPRLSHRVKHIWPTNFFFSRVHMDFFLAV